MRDTEREAETQEREKQAPHGEPNVGLNPGAPGSRPEPKADAHPCATQMPPDIHSFTANTAHYQPWGVD